MSAEIVNLRRARKQRARDEKAKQSAENRLQSGRPKHERRRRQADQEQDLREHEGNRLIGDPNSRKPGEDA